MNFRSSGVAAGLLAVVVTGCATAPASSPGPGGHPAAPSGCQRLANDTLTLASNGRTYCVRVGEKFDVYLRGTVANPWLEPLASTNVIVGVPNGALSLVAGLTGASFAGARPGHALITSMCAPQRRFSVSIVVTR